MGDVEGKAPAKGLRRRKATAAGAGGGGGTALTVSGADADGDAGTPKARLPRFGQEVIVPLRERHDGWTPLRQRAFLRGLGELGSVTDACKRVGMSTTSAYRLRTQSGEFSNAWDKAVDIVQPILEQAAFERGVEGWDEAVFQGGKLAGYKRRYSDAALGMLMKREGRAGAGPGRGASQEELEDFAREAARRAGGYFRKNPKEVSMADVEASLNRKIDAIIRARAKGAGAG